MPNNPDRERIKAEENSNTIKKLPYASNSAKLVIRI